MPKTHKQISRAELLSLKAVVIYSNHQALRNRDMASETYERLVTFQMLHVVIYKMRAKCLQISRLER